MGVSFGQTGPDIEKNGHFRHYHRYCGERQFKVRDLFSYRENDHVSDMTTANSHEILYDTRSEQMNQKNQSIYSKKNVVIDLSGTLDKKLEPLT